MFQNKWNDLYFLACECAAEFSLVVKPAMNNYVSFNDIFGVTIETISHLDCHDLPLPYASETPLIRRQKFQFKIILESSLFTLPSESRMSVLASFDVNTNAADRVINFDMPTYLNSSRSNYRNIYAVAMCTFSFNTMRRKKTAHSYYLIPQLSSPADESKYS